MLTDTLIRSGVQAALQEDSPWGDLTGEVLVPAEAVATARMVAREAGVLSGGRVVDVAFTTVDPAISVRLERADGDALEPGTVVATVVGPARGVLRAERVALNFVQRMSGIATQTRAYVEAVAGTGVRIVDTRKTTPGLRAFERYAVRCGGGHNHRFSLSDAVMAKDNHLAVLGDDPERITSALRAAREALPHTVHLEVEVDRLDQLDAVLAAGVDTVMLDNFTLEDLRTGVEKVAGRALVEASGGITLPRVGEIALTGVDLISVGALTHSVAALDLGLDVEVAV
ncbi:carboxylating nicotinate-nucleotide diphosphorylase [Mumia sp. zg.B53]|uniref:carboxylating nicotinate-nucleotide diphosphorylase n=1 Tax=unclassified Mumia TaxID=2621872 RepID=UPI001C6E9366|nr:MULTISPECIES: carboxylating nicotinate-nucleotide diphosphorylase [unclassified Mumia]MBW9208045.1 carboxylating nicotinate-nucleotide diphosphorylase [Mumia sp. zg.B21]MBW9215999.1 carboxylating nicotinate-nucleotide diphosphorylase [Mumia sp. zg.B53]MDD9350334.1 carboxylating nicotinate-nucleotide diphosphorylase [Mumia sp.]